MRPWEGEQIPLRLVSGTYMYILISEYIPTYERYPTFERFVAEV